MPRKGWRKQRPVVGDPSDPQGMAAALQRYVNHLVLKNYSPRTIELREYHVFVFVAWCDERAITRPGKVTPEILSRYQNHLRHHHKTNGQEMTPQTRGVHVTSIRMFFKWLARENLIPWNPASEMDLPKTGFYLPRGVLSQSDIEQILNAIDVSKRMGIRDRALIEVLYSTGIRRREATNLDISDLKPDQGVVLIRQGKGGIDRMVPIGERAIKWTEKYLIEVRPNLIPHHEETALFLCQGGYRFTPNNIGQVVKKRIKESSIQAEGCCHVFRHSMATHMLENGADIRYIQEILGHARLETTQIYTKVSIDKLKEIHTATHPAKLHRDVHPQEEQGRQSDDD